MATIHVAQQLVEEYGSLIGFKKAVKELQALARQHPSRYSFNPELLQPLINDPDGVMVQMRQESRGYSGPLITMGLFTRAQWEMLRMRLTFLPSDRTCRRDWLRQDLISEFSSEDFFSALESGQR